MYAAVKDAMRSKEATADLLSNGRSCAKSHELYPMHETIPTSTTMRQRAIGRSMVSLDLVATA